MQQTNWLWSNFDQTLPFGLGVDQGTGAVRYMTISQQDTGYHEKHYDQHQPSQATPGYL